MAGSAGATDSQHRFAFGWRALPPAASRPGSAGAFVKGVKSLQRGATPALATWRHDYV
jgi:hypothetical protein